MTFPQIATKNGWAHWISARCKIQSTDEPWQVGPHPALTFRVQTLAQLSATPLWRRSTKFPWYCHTNPIPPMWALQKDTVIAEYSKRILIMGGVIVLNLKWYEYPGNGVSSPNLWPQNFEGTFFSNHPQCWFEFSAFLRGTPGSTESLQELATFPNMIAKLDGSLKISWRSSCLLTSLAHWML